MLIERKARPAHWYLKDGTPFYEVPKKDGSGMRPSTIRDAQAAGALRSVTNVLSVLGKPGLEAWKIEQAILSALTLPRRPGEDEHLFAARALADSEEQAHNAAKEGTRLHDLAAGILLKNSIAGLSEADARLLLPFFDWVQANVSHTVYSEVVVVNTELYYAGRLDAFVQLKSGPFAILDLKTQDVAKDKKGFPKASFYDEWAIQLAAYAACEVLETWTKDPIKLISVVIGRNEPCVQVREWHESPDHFHAFCHACHLWSYLKGCTPGRKGGSDLPA